MQSDSKNASSTDWEISANGFAAGDAEYLTKDNRELFRAGLLKFRAGASKKCLNQTSAKKARHSVPG